jgi:hypothetical protein
MQYQVHYSATDSLPDTRSSAGVRSEAAVDGTTVREKRVNGDKIVAVKSLDCNFQTAA